MRPSVISGYQGRMSRSQSYLSHLPILSLLLTNLISFTRHAISLTYDPISLISGYQGRMSRSQSYLSHLPSYLFHWPILSLALFILSLSLVMLSLSLVIVSLSAEREREHSGVREEGAEGER